MGLINASLKWRSTFKSAILLWLYFPANLDWESFRNFTSTGIISQFCTPVNDDGTPFSFVNNKSTPDNAVKQ